MRIKDALVAHRVTDSVVNPEYLSHGTLECYRLDETRRFYERFLGLECVRHAKPSMAIRCGLRFHIVCLEVGDQLHPANVDNHWGIDVGSVDDVHRIWRVAHERRDEFGIRQVTDVVKQHGVFSFYLEDLDHNWWEFQYYDGTQHDDMFDFGDRYTGSELHEAASVS